MRAFGRVILMAAILYPAGYIAFRMTKAERWDRDGQTYVMFPASGLGHALYYAWRPLSRLDATLTGMQTHLGPHR
jgi:hypothetical protein